MSTWKPLKEGAKAVPLSAPPAPRTQPWEPYQCPANTAAPPPASNSSPQGLGGHTGDGFHSRCIELETKCVCPSPLDNHKDAKVSASPPRRAAQTREPEHLKDPTQQRAGQQLRGQTIPAPTHTHTRAVNMQRHVEGSILTLLQTALTETTTPLMHNLCSAFTENVTFQTAVVTYAERRVYRLSLTILWH